MQSAVGQSAAYPPLPLSTKIAQPGPDLTRRISEGAHLGEIAAVPGPDVEHLPVRDDPRLWSWRKKHSVLLIITMASLCSGLTANIFLPALQSLQTDLGITNGFLSTTLAIFILIQGLGPILWTAISELRGRKAVYIAAFTLYCSATIVASRAQSKGVFFAMRMLQAGGASAVLAIGGGTLAELFDSFERGQKLGIYYLSPLLGPSIGSLLGGALVQRGSWRNGFYFLSAFGFTSLASFFWMHETFRPIRSKAYSHALKRHNAAVSRLASRNTSLDTINFPPDVTAGGASHDPIVKISLRDANPLAAVGSVLRVPMNALAVVFSGMLFGIQYSLSYTGARAFASAPYNYSPVIVGVILLVLGIGSMIGSVVGGWYSDKVFVRMKERNGGSAEPKMRLLSIRVAMIFFPPSLLCYGWLLDRTVPIYWVCLPLFVIGLSSTWIYSSVLAYVVDANPGRSSSAIACNSAARGIFGCALTYIAPAVLDAVGQGVLYSIWCGISILFIILLLFMSRLDKTRLH